MPPSLLFHVFSNCFTFGCFREKIRLSCFKAFQNASDSINYLREVFEKRLSKKVLEETAFHSFFLKNVGTYLSRLSRFSRKVPPLAIRAWLYFLLADRLSKNKTVAVKPSFLVF
jgi:hypothetical protein